MPTNPLVMSELVGGDSSAINTPVIEQKETSKQDKAPIKQEKVEEPKVVPVKPKAQQKKVDAPQKVEPFKAVAQKSATQRVEPKVQPLKKAVSKVEAPKPAPVKEVAPKAVQKSTTQKLEPKVSPAKIQAAPKATLPKAAAPMKPINNFIKI